MQFLDRVQRLRGVQAYDPISPPHNWSDHPPSPPHALCGVREEIGSADAQVVSREDKASPPDAVPSIDPPPPVTYSRYFQLVVECGSEARQEELYHRLRAEGLRCRVLTL